MPVSDMPQKNNLFSTDEMVCTKTLYNYVDLGILTIKNIDLPEKLKRNTKSSALEKAEKYWAKVLKNAPKQ